MPDGHSFDERELKLRVDDPEVLDRLAGVNTLGPFRVVDRGDERQRSAYFDTPEGALRRARLALRRRTIVGQALAVYTVKGAGTTLRGVAIRPEVEVWLDPDTPPMVALSLLRQAARERGSAALAEALADALVGASPPLATPLVELVAHRRLLHLEDRERGWRVELALDSVHKLGDPTYHDLEVEAELQDGNDDALEAIREALGAYGLRQFSEGNKLTRALASADVTST